MTPPAGTNTPFSTLKQRHLDFWERKDASTPLIGFTVGAGTDSWSYWRDNAAIAPLWGKGRIEPDDLDPQQFIDDQRKYLALSDMLEDDVCRTAMPLPSIPWMEAILGCPVVATEAHFASCPILKSPAEAVDLQFEPENAWVRKYIEFIDVYNQAFGCWHPVSQSVLRGPSDLACALLGPEQATMALIEQPDEIMSLLERVTDIQIKFLNHQRSHLQPFEGGWVIGQYEIWAPGTVLRMQEDFSTLYSPKFYRKFLYPMDCRISEQAEYSLIHLHATSLFLIDEFLKVPSIRVFQVTKDPGATQLTNMIPGLKKIQEGKRCLILKGRFDGDDLALIKKELIPAGLCLQPVADSVDEASRQLPFYRTW